MTSKFCEKHGGSVDLGDAFWACDICARNSINKCKCGSPARYFGEAMLSTVECEAKCGEYTTTLCYDGNVKEMWNEGKRGYFEG